LLATALAVAAAALPFSLASPAAAANCTAAQKAGADSALGLSAAGEKAAIITNLPWGVPVTVGSPEHESLLVQKDYVTLYDADLRDPLWVAYKLDASRLGKSPRIDCFRADPRLGGQDASAPSDYDEPIFDQGHLANNADMTLSANAVINSFLMSNMTPQYCQFNEGVWEMTENIVRLWAKAKDPLYVITGAIFDRNGDHRRDPDDVAVRMRSMNGKARVAVPSAFYKIVAQQKSASLIETIAIALPNDQTDLDHQAAVDYIAGHVTTIAAIEQVTGEKFFAGFSGTIAEAKTFWPFTGSPGHSLVGPRCRATAPPVT
jgi:DNA/RNA endonuclease G (NUC1)